MNDEDLSQNLSLDSSTYLQSFSYFTGYSEEPKWNTLMGEGIYSLVDPPCSVGKVNTVCRVKTSRSAQVTQKFALRTQRIFCKTQNCLKMLAM